MLLTKLNVGSGRIGPQSETTAIIGIMRISRPFDTATPALKGCEPVSCKSQRCVEMVDSSSIRARGKLSAQGSPLRNS